MNIIDQFLNESNIPIFKTPEELSKWMNNVKYGFIGKNNKKYLGTDREKFEKYFYNEYVLQLPEELYKSKVGVCWDQTIFEKYIFDKMFNYENHMIFIQQYKVATHTFLVYKLNNKWMYFENSFNANKGIHGPFNSIKEIVNNVYKKMQEFEKGTSGFDWSIMDPKKFKKKLNAEEFMNNCGYNWKKMEEQKPSETKSLNEMILYYNIQNSKIHNKGCFAKIDISKNTNIGLSFKKIKNTGKDDVDYIRTDLGKYTNHSDIPNLILKKKSNMFFYITNRNIKKGEELTLNYKTFPWEGKRDFVEN